MKKEHFMINCHAMFTESLCYIGDILIIISVIE